jgi:hypothetical protein
MHIWEYIPIYGLTQPQLDTSPDPGVDSGCLGESGVTVKLPGGRGPGIERRANMQKNDGKSLLGAARVA